MSTIMESSGITVLPAGSSVHLMRYISQPVFKTPMEKYISKILQNKAIDALDQNRYLYTRFISPDRNQSPHNLMPRYRLMHISKLDNWSNFDAVLEQCDNAVGAYYWKRYNLSMHENNTGTVLLSTPIVNIYNSDMTIYVQTIVDICQ